MQRDSISFDTGGFYQCLSSCSISSGIVTLIRFENGTIILSGTLLVVTRRSLNPQLHLQPLLGPSSTSLARNHLRVDTGNFLPITLRPSFFGRGLYLDDILAEAITWCPAPARPWTSQPSARAIRAHPPCGQQGPGARVAISTLSGALQCRLPYSKPGGHVMSCLNHRSHYRIH